ncbi:hypothetical protein AWH49_16875 [Domibacillus aminovorans]|uniref:DUF1641 domain-containing protein n=1 Tax=Domibacillus aminovorans TaxID=29332 RepID=A0A177L4Y0_9BACI|nr:hypothetical protein AWH49_16875 [Domibacillus aminovorans]
MAKPITKIHHIELTEEEKRKQDLLEIEQMLADNKEVIKELFSVINKMKDRNVLNMVNSLFGQGDRVLDIVVKAADKPETANTIKNLLLMLGMLGTLNVQQLEPVILKVNNGIARMAQADKEDAGYVSMIYSLSKPEVKRAISLLFTFLKGMGENKQELERTTQLPEDQAGTILQAEKMDMQPEPIHEQKQLRVSKGWMVAAAGVSVIGIAMSRKPKK